MYAILTPFIIPPGSAKRCNIGDGFIALAIERLLSPARCQYSFSTRAPLDPESLEKINSTKALILAGANQLNDTYSLVPSFRPRDLRRIKVPIFPFGVGYSGRHAMNRKMSRATRYLLDGIHERIRYSSWRCPFTVDYLRRSLPHLDDKFLMTGCPVAYDAPILSDRPFPREIHRVIVTVTERGAFWEREQLTIDYVASAYSAAEKILSLHQSFEDAQAYTDTRYGRTPSELHAYAQDLGFSIYRAKDVHETQALYRTADLHVGSRLHAHLFCLSQAKRSFLTYVDERCRGFSLMYTFPIVDPRRFRDYADYDFSIYRQQVQYYSRTMAMFTHSVKNAVS